MLDNRVESNFPKILKVGEPMLLGFSAPWVFPVDKIEPLIRICHKDQKSYRKEAYLKNRQEVWESEKRRLGVNLWNEFVYSIEKIEWIEGEIVLSVNQIEYKDIVFKNKLGAQKIAEKFSASAVPRHMFSALMPINKEKRVLLGKVGSLTTQVAGSLDFIGGSLNVNDLDYGFKSLDSVRSFSVMEFHEETGLKIEPSTVKLWTINYDGDCLFFIFKVCVNFEKLLSNFRASREMSDLMIVDFLNGSRNILKESKDVYFVKSYFSLLEG